MKRLLFVFALIMGFAFCANAQVYRYKTTYFAMKQVVNGKWTNWSKWEESDMLVTIDWTNDVVKIYSPATQTYYLTKFVGEYKDESGGVQYEFNFIDQDDDKGTMRLRIESNGSSQLYVDFANIMLVWVVRRIKD